MKKIAFAVVPLVLCVIVASLMWGVCGCEKNDGDGIRFLTLEPTTLIMGTNVYWVTITVVDGTRELSFPLTWEVQNAGIGFIVEPAAGASAVYRRTPNNGQNIVTVRDQYGTEGYCYISQVNYSTDESGSTTTTTTSTTTTTTTQ